MSVCSVHPLYMSDCIANVAEFISSHTVLAGVARLYVRHIQPTVLLVQTFFLMSAICVHPAPNQILPYLSCVCVCVYASVAFCVC